MSPTREPTHGRAEPLTPAGGGAGAPTVPGGAGSLSRRAALRRTGAALAGLLLPRGLVASQEAPGILVLTAPTGSARRGVALGLEEATHAARLLRRPLRIHYLEDGPSRSVTDQVRGRAASGTTVLVSALEVGARVRPTATYAREVALRAEGAAEEAGLLLVDGGAVQPDASSYAPLVFRVGVRVVGAVPEGASEALLWHHSLERYGARQLNERFRARFGEPMDGPAWAAWFATKVAAEAVLRSSSWDPESLAAFLEGPAAAFDGHKGRPLRFSSLDHALEQPLYALVKGPRGEESVEELAPEPGRGVARCDGDASRIASPA